MTLSGKRILVTGGTGKLGRALVRRLIEEDAWVAVTYRDNGSLATLLSELDPNGPQPKAVQCELADRDSLEALAEELAQVEALPLHGLAHLAGGWAGGEPLWEAPASLLHELMRDNVLSTWNVLRRFAGGMVEAGYGRIVTVGARQAVIPMKGNTAYAAVKGAVASLTTTLAEDLRGTGVTATCVLPRHLGAEAGPGIVPYDEAAALIVWLLDEDARAANGDLVHVTGGA